MSLLEKSLNFCEGFLCKPAPKLNNALTNPGLVGVGVGDLASLQCNHHIEDSIILGRCGKDYLQDDNA